MAQEHDDVTDVEEKDLDQVEVEEHEEEEEEATAKVDSEIEDAASDDEREEIRERRRKEKRSRSQRHREKIEAMERNLAALMAKNQQLEQQVAGIQDTNVGSQLAQVDNAIAQANQAAEHFKSVIAQAAARGDGKTIADATEYMIASRNRASELEQFKKNATRAINAPKPLNPTMVSKSQQFLGKNQWYSGPTSSDPDSKVLTAIDNSLAAEGWDPTSDAYWNELEARGKKYLPHRFSAKSDARPRNPVSGASAPGGSGNKDDVFQLSPARVAAIKSAGMWDDPAARNKMIKSYRDYDKANKRG